MAAKPKSKPKPTGPLATALSREKASVATYQKMEADATKKNKSKEISLFRGLRSDAEKHVKNIESTSESIKKDEAKQREKAKIEREKAAKAKASAKPKAAKSSSPLHL
ncbi:MAG: hypothetical protein WED07_03035 [Candidatus Freyarchaeum deiterrae]